MADELRKDWALGVLDRVAKVAREKSAETLAKAVDEMTGDHLLDSSGFFILLSDIESVLENISRIHCPESLLPPNAKDSDQCGACSPCRARAVRNRLLVSGVLDEMKNRERKRRASDDEA